MEKAIETTRLGRFLDSDIWHSFKGNPVAIVSLIITFIMLMSAAFAPFIAPHDPFDMMKIDIMDSSLPPSWLEGGDPRFWLGTDDQGRDILSTIMYGARISLIVGFASVIFSMVVGITLGLISGYEDPLLAIAAAVWIHGEAGRLFGPGLIAEDIESCLPKIMLGLIDP